MPHYVYLAVSTKLLEWSNAELDRYAIKVGTSRKPEDRLMFLNGFDPRNGSSVLPCCGCADWGLTAKADAGSEEKALEAEEIFKSVFESLDVFESRTPPFFNIDLYDYGRKSNGETDILLFERSKKKPAFFSTYPPIVGSLYFSGMAKIFETVSKHAGEIDDQDADEIDHDYQLFLDDQEAEAEERNERHSRLIEDGHFYED